MELREAADRLALAEVLQRYFHALDTRDYPLLDRVFSPDARLLYDMGDGGTEVAYPVMRAQLERFNAAFLWTQHMAGLPLLEVDGEGARSTLGLRALHVQETAEGERSTWLVYGTYRDRHVRTPDGWRIRHRHFRAHHTEGQLLPADRLRRGMG